MKNKAKTTASLAAVAMMCHMLLHIASSVILSGLEGALKVGISILFTVLRLGIPILIMKFGGKKLALEDYSCHISFCGSEYFAVFVASFTAIFLFGLSYSLIFPSETSAVPDTSLERILSAVLLIAMPAFLEEYLMRRMIAGKLAVYNRSAAMIISALLFALMHFSAEKFPYTFVCGLILGAAYLKTGSFVIVMAVHFLNNLTAYASGVLSTFCTVRTCNIVTLSFAAVCLAATLITMPRLLRALKKEAAQDAETGATEMLSPVLLLYVISAMVHQIFSSEAHMEEKFMLEAIKEAKKRRLCSKRLSVPLSYATV